MGNFRIAIDFSLLLVACFLFSTSTGIRPSCIDNHVTHENETDDDVLGTFLEKLQTYTGMGDSKGVEVLCGGVPKMCVVDSNGTAIWDARMTFYENYMMNKIDSEDPNLLKNSLDGCLCYSNDVDDFRICMQSLRKMMTNDLDEILMPEFIKLVEANECALFADNCVQNDVLTTFIQ